MLISESMASPPKVKPTSSQIDGMVTVPLLSPTLLSISGICPVALDHHGDYSAIKTASSYQLTLSPTCSNLQEEELNPLTPSKEQNMSSCYIYITISSSSKKFPNPLSQLIDLKGWMDIINHRLSELELTPVGLVCPYYAHPPLTHSPSLQNHHHSCGNSPIPQKEKKSSLETT